MSAQFGLKFLRRLAVVINPVAKHASLRQEWGGRHIQPSRLKILAGDNIVVEIHRDHKIGAHGADDAHRYRVGEAAVHQDAAVAAHRGGEDARHGNIGAYRLDGIPLPDGNLLAGLDIRRYGTKRNRQRLNGIGLDMGALQFTHFGAVDQP